MTTLQDLVSSFKERGDKPALTWKSEDQTVKGILSYADLYTTIQEYSKGFLALGLEKGDRVAVVSANIPEATKLIFGLNNAGLVDVPRPEESTPDELKYILEHSDAKYVVVEDEKVLANVLATGFEEDRIISMKPSLGVKSMEDILNMASDLEVPKLTEEDMACIIYTSGTTGNPKGVVHTQGTLMKNIDDLVNDKQLSFGEDDVSMSGFLPIWHIYARTVTKVSLAVGAEVFYTHKSKGHLINDIAEQGTTIMASVPAVWNKVYNGVMRNVKKKDRRIKEKLGFEPIQSLVNKAVEYKADNKNSLGRLLSYKLADALVFKKVREKLGEHFNYAVSGGGALQPHVDRFLFSAGIDVLEGYGMTEMPVISVRRQKEGVEALHTVSYPLSQVKLEIRDEDGNRKSPGEEGLIHITSPYQFLGYYKMQGETDKVIGEDGWFNTEDLGYLRKDGRLSITGREKELIVTTAGENINPIPLEKELSKSDYIDTPIVVGQDRHCLGLLIVPEFEALQTYCESQGIPFDANDPIYTLKRTKIQNLYKQEIDRLTNNNKQAGFKGYEHLSNFVLLPEPFKEGEEFTYTLKPKRRIIEVTREQEINSMYGNVSSIPRSRAV